MTFGALKTGQIKYMTKQELNKLVQVAKHTVDAWKFWDVEPGVLDEWLTRLFIELEPYISTKGVNQKYRIDGNGRDLMRNWMGKWLQVPDGRYIKRMPPEDAANYLADLLEEHIVSESIEPPGHTDLMVPPEDLNEYIDEELEKTCICNHGFGMNLSCPIHKPEKKSHIVTDVDWSYSESYGMEVTWEMTNEGPRIRSTRAIPRDPDRAGILPTDDPTEVARKHVEKCLNDLKRDTEALVEWLNNTPRTIHKLEVQDIAYELDRTFPNLHMEAIPERVVLKVLELLNIKEKNE